MLILIFRHIFILFIEPYLLIFAGDAGGVFHKPILFLLCCLNLLFDFPKGNTRFIPPSILVSGSLTQNERLPYNAESPQQKPTSVTAPLFQLSPEMKTRPSFRVSP